MRLFLQLLIVVIGVSAIAGETHAEAINLVPEQPSTAPNYWCTWYWQNYAVRSGMPVTDPANPKKYSNRAARETLNEQAIFGENGWAKKMLPKTRNDYYFLIDHGWQDKSIEKSPFFSLVMDISDFPSYAHLEPRGRIKQMNQDIKALGWRGLGLWVRGSPTKADMKRMVAWSKYAGIEYWKIDGGDTDHYLAFEIKQKDYPTLTLEYITGSGGGLNSYWAVQSRQDYPSIYASEFQGVEAIPGLRKDCNHGMSKSMLHMLKHSDVFRTYDAAPLHVSTVTLQRLHDVLSQSTGDTSNVALLNIQDDCNLAAALGCVVAAKRHPLNGSRLYHGEDFHHQINGDRHVDRRLDEMDRFVRWQRIAPPMPAGYGFYKASKRRLIDQHVYGPESTWMQETHGKLVTQSAPAVMARNIELPTVHSEGEPPYVVASKFPNGAVCVATEGRVSLDSSWRHPRADVTLAIGEVGKPIGIFGHYASLTFKIEKAFSDNTSVLAQDLLANTAEDITDRIKITDNAITIPGDLIDTLGVSAGTLGDISSPGIVLSIQSP